MNDFTKFDGGIVDSSIWDEPSDVLKVFQTFWAKSDAHGIVRATVDALYRAANLRDKDRKPLPFEAFDVALHALQAPDPRSRSSEHEGRRILRIGESEWLIVNYEKYRLPSVIQREKTRLRVQKFRKKKRDEAEQNSCNGYVTPPSILFYSGSVPVPEGVQGEALPEKGSPEVDEVKPLESPESPSEIEEFKRTIGELFSRSAMDTWSYAEEHALAEILKRPNRDSELIEICVFRRDEFFPRSLSRLLQTWTEVLDRSRNPKQKGVENRTPLWRREQILKEEIDNHPANKQSAGYNPKCSEKQKTELAQLRERLKTIRKEMIS